MRPVRVRNKPSGASRASPPPGHAVAAAPQPACQTRGTNPSSPGARACPGPPSFFFPGHARVDATLTAKAARRKSPFNSISFSEHARAATGSAQHVSRQGAPPRRGTPVVVLAGEKKHAREGSSAPPVPHPQFESKKEARDALPDTAPFAKV